MYDCNDSEKEYAITHPSSTNWLNDIGRFDLGGIVNQYCEDLYVRIYEERGYQLLSLFNVTNLSQFTSYECHVGLGYSTYEMVTEKLEIQIKSFAPIKHNVLLRDITIKNISDKALDFDVIPVVEYNHFESIKKYSDKDFVPQSMMSDLRKDGPFTILNQYAFMDKDIAVNYFTSNVTVQSFETNRRRFLRDHEGGTWQNPLSLKEENLSNYENGRGDNIAALLHTFKSIKPNQFINITTQLGQYEHYEEELKQIRYYRQADNVQMAFDELKSFWMEHLSTLKAQTTDENFDRRFNIFNPRQCFTINNLSRYLSLCQLGLDGSSIGISNLLRNHSHKHSYS